MDYGDIFKRGFQVTWQNKFIYILGFLAALGGSGGGGGGNVNVPNNFGGSSGGGPAGGDFGDIEGTLENLFGDPDFIFRFVGAAIAIVCILFLFRLIMYFLRLISEAGMIQAVTDIETGVKTDFRKAFADGRPFMLKFFITQLIVFGIPVLLMLLLGGLVAVPVIMSGGDDPGPAMALFAIPLVCLACLFVPYNFIVSIVYPIAQRGMVLRQMEPMESLWYGWELLKERTSDIVILAILFSVTGFIVGIVTAIFAIPILLATGWPVLSAFMDGNVPGFGAFSLLGVGVILMIVIGSLVSAVYVSFRSSAFTLAYFQLDQKALPQA